LNSASDTPVSSLRMVALTGLELFANELARAPLTWLLTTTAAPIKPNMASDRVKREGTRRREEDTSPLFRLSFCVSDFDAT